MGSGDKAAVLSMRNQAILDPVLGAKSSTSRICTSPDFQCCNPQLADVSRGFIRATRGLDALAKAIAAHFSEIGR